MTFAEAAGLALATGGLALIAVALVGALRRWNRAQVKKVASSWGIRLWVSLLMLAFGIAVLAFRPIAETGLGGVLLVAFGGVSLVLVLRAFPGAGTEPGMFTATGGVSPRYFDYLIWTFIGIPIVGITVIVVGLIIGAR